MNTLILCGKQNIALRGHGDAGRGGNQGNFHALLRFRLDAGDTTLESHFKTAGRNAQYTSPTIQSDLPVCIGEWIRNRIVDEVLESKFFFVCADEVADMTNREQMALIVRFVDKQGHIREEFLDFIHCDEGTTGRALSGKIISSLQDNGLDMNYLRGQGYDGAGNMAGIREGAAAHITAIYSKALYCHGTAHVLNLCVVAACKIQAVNKMMPTMKEINLFFSHSPKRQQEIECYIAKWKILDQTGESWWTGAEHGGLRELKHLKPLTGCFQQL